MPSNDLTIYSEYAHEWWTPGAPRFRSLQNLTPFRLSLIKEHLGETRGKRVLDVGCGGGLISIPLIAEGADVLGCDLSEGSIKAAQKASNGKGKFFVADACRLPLPAESVDHVLLMDLVDHIPNYQIALNEAARVVRKGGRVFVGTINRTFRSKLFAIFLGEGLGLIPKGTHSHELFITPTELSAAASSANLSLIARQGERINLIETVRRWAITMERGPSEAVAYSMVFSKLYGRNGLYSDRQNSVSKLRGDVGNI